MDASYSKINQSDVINFIRDWQLLNGSVRKVQTPTGELLSPVPVAATPTKIPAKCFKEPKNLQVVWNELYAAVATDEEWLQEILDNALDLPELEIILWSIHKRAKLEGFVQPWSLAIYRCDYLLHLDEEIDLEASSRQIGVESLLPLDEFDWTEHAMPPNDTAKNIVKALAVAHSHYDKRTNSPTLTPGVLIIAQPDSVNFADERWIEFELQKQDIPCYRGEWAASLLASLSLSRHKELIFCPRPGHRKVEIAVVYYCAGGRASDYGETGRAFRQAIETSKAIKCPSVLGQLSGSEYIRQYLLQPKNLERFLPKGKIDRLVASLPDRNLPDTNSTDVDIKGLTLRPDSGWKPVRPFIKPPKFRNLLISASGNGNHQGQIVSRLGMYGMCCWHYSPANAVSPPSRGELPPLSKGEDGKPCREADDRGWDVNQQLGFLFISKPLFMTATEAFGDDWCFDSPRLIS